MVQSLGFRVGDLNATVRHPCNMGSRVWDLGFEGLDGKVSEQ